MIDNIEEMNMRQEKPKAYLGTKIMAEPQKEPEKLFLHMRETLNDH